jgi:hypothetical protein
MLQVVKDSLQCCLVKELCKLDLKTQTIRKSRSEDFLPNFPQPENFEIRKTIHPRASNLPEGCSRLSDLAGVCSKNALPANSQVVLMLLSENHSLEPLP